MQRDRQLVLWIARFDQLTSAHIRALEFRGLKSRTSCDNRLTALTKLRYIRRVQADSWTGGSRGGRGPYVYQLDEQGFLLVDREYKGRKSKVQFHQLLAAEAFTAVWTAAQQGSLTLTDYDINRDAGIPYVDIDGKERTHKPDFTLDLTVGSKRRFIWVEVDMGTEWKKQIKDKMARAWLAMTQTSTDDYPTPPVVVWIAENEYRAAQLRMWIDQGKDAEKKAYFKVVTLDQFVPLLLS